MVTFTLTTPLPPQEVGGDASGWNRFCCLAACVNAASLSVVATWLFGRARRQHRTGAAVRGAVAVAADADTTALRRLVQNSANGAVLVKLKATLAAREPLSSPSTGLPCLAWATRTFTHFDQISARLENSGSARHWFVRPWRAAVRGSYRVSKDMWHRGKLEVASAGDTAQPIEVRLLSGSTGGSVGGDGQAAPAEGTPPPTHTRVELHLAGATGGPGRTLMEKVADEFTPARGGDGASSSPSRCHYGQTSEEWTLRGDREYVVVAELTADEFDENHLLLRKPQAATVEAPAFFSGRRVVLNPENLPFCVVAANAQGEFDLKLRQAERHSRLAFFAAAAASAAGAALAGWCFSTLGTGDGAQALPLPPPPGRAHVAASRGLLL